MANEQNLRPCEYKLSQEEQKKGGIASGKTRREKAEFKRLIERLLDEEVEKKDKNGNVIETITTAEALVLAQIQKALKGDTRAFETVRDTVGQKPVEKVMITEVSQDVINEVEQAVYESE